MQNIEWIIELHVIQLYYKIMTHFNLRTFKLDVHVVIRV
jgi:hypothetical protein